MESSMGDREPFPHGIVDHVGIGFVMGAGGGSIYHFFKGLKSSPRGERFAGGSQAVRMNAPRTAGSLAAWCGIFSVSQYSMIYLRQKEDPWNSIIAGAVTGGYIQLRAGLRAACANSVRVGVCMALMEGAGIIYSKRESEKRQQQQQIIVEDFQAKKKKSVDGVKTEILEGFDAPKPPTFDFEK